MSPERMETILHTIDKMGITTVRQLHEILKFGSYRNTCRLVADLSEYLHAVRTKEKIVYLNKEGRRFIDSKKEIKKSPLFEHMLLLNEVYIYFNCPYDWKREYVTEIVQNASNSFGIQINGLTLTNKKKVVTDAVFSRNGYLNLIEVDNTRSMVDNQNKINTYHQMWSEFKNARLHVFTKSQKRKQIFQTLLKGIPSEVYTFAEIK